MGTNRYDDFDTQVQCEELNPLLYGYDPHGRPLDELDSEDVLDHVKLNA